MFKNIRRWWKWNIHTPIQHFLGRKASTDWISAYNFMARAMLPYLHDFKKNDRQGTPIFNNELSDDDRTAKWDGIIDEVIFALEQCANDGDDSDCYEPNPNYNPAQKEFFKKTPMNANGTYNVEFNEDYGDVRINSELYRAKQERIQKGLLLLGEYFQNFWD